jgi:hypothetical protein
VIRFLSEQSGYALNFPGSAQSLIAQGIDEQEALRIETHNATHPEPVSPYGWTDEWVTRVFLPLVPVRTSRQEAAALHNFARWERGRGGQGQNA